MPAISLTSDMLETLLTPQEEHLAKQFMQKELSIAYLQNTKVALVRSLAMQEFDKPEEDEKNQRVRAYLKGQFDLLTALIETAIETTDLSQEQQAPINASLINGDQS